MTNDNKTLYKAKLVDNTMYIIASWCFYIVNISLMWAFWENISFLPMSFSIASMGLFLCSGVFFLANIKHLNFIKHSVLCYICFIIWSIIMIIAYNYCYSMHDKKNFLFFYMDSYALFFIRVFIIILPAMFFVDFNKMIAKKSTKFILLIIVVSSAFFMARAIQAHPDAVRARATMEFLGYGDFLKGVPDYGQVYAMAIIFPVFLYKAKNSIKFEKFCYVIILGLMAYIIIFSQFATALIILIIGIFIYLFLSVKPSQKVFVGLLFLFFVLIVVFMDGGADILNWLSKHTVGAWSTKLRDMASSLSGRQDSGMVSSRVDLYNESFKSFLASPIFGKFIESSGDIGGHATNIDILGLAGLFGFSFWALTIYFNYVRMVKFCTTKDAKVVVITCTIQFILLASLKNIISAMAIFLAFFVIIPAFIKSTNTEEKKESSYESY